MPARKIDLWALIDQRGQTDCWLWQGRLDENGYGRLGKRSLMVHRVVYEQLVGPIPDGYEIDHVCHNISSCSGGVGCCHRACANPAHLEAVTHAENTLRGRGFSAVNARKTHCPQGHLYDEQNTYVWAGAPGNTRACRTCIADRSRRAA